MPLASQDLLLFYFIMYEPGSKCSLGWVPCRRVIYWGPSIFIFILSSLYLVEYILNPNSMIEIAVNLWPQGHCSSPNFRLFVQKLAHQSYIAVILTRPGVTEHPCDGGCYLGRLLFLGHCPCPSNRCRYRQRLHVEHNLQHEVMSRWSLWWKLWVSDGGRFTINRCPRICSGH